MSFLFDVGFHRTGKPRKWLVLVLFQENWTVRPIFRRVVYKKNGRVRPRFAYWVSEAAKQKQDAGTGSQVTSAEEQPLRPEELALQAMVPLESTVKGWRNRSDPDRMLDKEALAGILSQSRGEMPHQLVLSIGQDNYTKVPGGVQLCIQREQKLAAASGLGYLQIHPWHPLPRLAHQDEEPDTIVGLILDGTDIGTCRMSTLVALTNDLASTTDVRVVVHHLLGHLPEQVAELTHAAGSGRCVLWLHDFFTMCPSYTLQRNNLTFCGGPSVKSNACNLCIYGTERTVHRERMAAFFRMVRVDVASPSAVTADFWQARSGLLAESLSVLPHMELDIVRRRQPSKDGRARPVTIGYLGAPVQHKGWPVFTNLMHANAGTNNYRFVVMSAKRPMLGEDNWVSVRVTAENLTAMSDAVAAEDVDIVLHWPSWPETFSFTTFEALAGSAYVVTNSGSGNVAAAIRQTGRGAILQDEPELAAFFRDGRAKALAEHRRETNQNFEIVHRHSEMSFPLLRKK